MASAPAGLPRSGDEIRPKSRPLELEDSLNRFVYHPLAARLARLLRPTGISPNAVSVGSLVALIAAAWAYTSLAWPGGVLLGFALMLAWHVIDGADGDLARLKGIASSTGELVDGVCDYAGNVILYFAFVFLLDDWIGAWAWIAAVAAGASHILQTNHAESQRRAYLWWAYGVPWLKNAKAADDAVFGRGSWFTRYFGFWAVGYVRLSNAMNPGAARIDAAVAAAQGDKRRTRRIRLLVRRGSRMSVALQKALGANPKTLIIAASMALGSPLWFFLTEIFVLNLLLAVSVRHHNRVNRRLAALLGRR
jgi:phosphatidylglycerophosphate synthase